MSETPTFMPENPIFALDIGTHSIIGVVGYAEERTFHVLDVCQMQYPQRAMKDGQIEDIDLVASVAGRVRRQLEEHLGITLTDVYIAAAGRALRTQRAVYEQEVPGDEAITQRQIGELETMAIQQAEEALLEQHQEQQYYYIGHSVVGYYLDDYPLSTLLGHKGRRIRAEVIATFLPAEVVESLYSTMRKVGLTVNSLTLEPIAAMNAIIPQELRMLNLALVDIGAGTSDIALSEAGSVSAYTMATIAGDEITERIVHEFLVDFTTAEQMKISLSQGQEIIHYEDILGFSYTVSAADLKARTLPAAELLCEEICSHILSTNGKAPSAVFMVGGGSKLPDLCGMVARRLEMDEKKVAVGGNNYMKRMVVADMDLSGPEYATPMGIALTAMQTNNVQKFCVTLNGRLVELLHKKPTNVIELLMMQGYERSQLLGRAGKSITYELDGRRCVVRGGHPVAAVISVNGRPASITTAVEPDAVIEVEPSVPGQDAQITVAHAVEDYHVFQLTIDGIPCQAGTRVFVNGEEASGDRLLRDLDHLQVQEVHTLADLCYAYELDPSSSTLKVNGMPQTEQYLLQPDDEVTTHEETLSPKKTAEDAVSAAPEDTPAAAVEQEAPVAEPLSASVQDTSVTAVEQGPPADIQTADTEQPPADTPTVFDKFIRVELNGMLFGLPPKPDKTQYLFIDMLNFVDIDPSKPEGNIILKRNHHDAAYLEGLYDGDVIEIRWEAPAK